MNDLIRIPCVLMRGGTSRGPFFLASDLPQAPAARDAVLLSVMGSGHPLEIDGIGGGNALTSKVAIVGPSRRPGADVDYLFAQVKVLEQAVDTSPNCGNMLAAVGPFAIEAGLVPVQDGVTTLRIHNVNTGKVIESRVLTPGGRVLYDGDVAISGVPGTAAPITLTFLDSAGSKTGALLPTGAARNTFDGVEVTCLDAAMPVVILRAADLGKTGQESPAELNADSQFLRRLESIRIQAGEAMGIANVRDRVIPKPVLIAPGVETGQTGDSLITRYFMPHECHSALAITGAVALANACATPGTLAAEMTAVAAFPAELTFAHATGRLQLTIDHPAGAPAPVVSVIRTARRLFEGAVFAKPSVWEKATPQRTENRDPILRSMP